MRRFKKGKIEFLTLCRRGANKQPVVYKADADITLETILKASDDLGEITALVYVPEMVDAQGDVASAEVIKDLAYGFLQSGGKIDILHNEKPVSRDRAYVAESFIVQKGDPRFEGWKDYDGNPIDPTGAWGTVIKVNDPTLRALYRDGRWNGVSMGGTAEFEQITKAHEEGTKMNEEQIRALVAETVAKALAPKPAAVEVPKFKGDITRATPRQIREHAALVKKALLLKELDLNDPEALLAFADDVEKEQKEAEVAKASALPAHVEKAEEAEDDGLDPMQAVAKFIADAANAKTTA